MPARGLCRPVQRLLPGEGALSKPIKIKPLSGLCARSRLRFGFAPLIPSLIPSSIKRKGCRGCTLCRDMCLWLALLRLLRLFSTICRPLHSLAFVVLKPFHFIIKRVKHRRAVAKVANCRLAPACYARCFTAHCRYFAVFLCIPCTKRFEVLLVHRVPPIFPCSFAVCRTVQASSGLHLRPFTYLCPALRLIALLSACTLILAFTRLLPCVRL